MDWTRHGIDLPGHVDPDFVDVLAAFPRESVTDVVAQVRDLDGEQQVELWRVSPGRIRDRSVLVDESGQPVEQVRTVGCRETDAGESLMLGSVGELVERDFLVRFAPGRLPTRVATEDARQRHYQVFISYKSEHHAFASDVRRALERAHVDAWFATDRDRFDFAQEVPKILAASSFVLILWCEQSHDGWPVRSPTPYKQAHEINQALHELTSRQPYGGTLLVNVDGSEPLPELRDVHAFGRDDAMAWLGTSTRSPSDRQFATAVAKHVALAIQRRQVRAT